MRPGVLALAMVLALSPPAVASQGLSREQALARLASQDAEARREGAASLGEAGTMADVPALVQALRDRDGMVRALAERSLWQVWSRSGDAEIDALFARGLEQMSMRAGAAAIATFTRIIDKKPEFAEGWNKRATMYYLAGEYDKSLRDCDEVMKRNPAHFGALSGYGQIYLRLGQPDKALPYFERALAVNPNLEGVSEVIDQLREVVRRRNRDTT